MTRNMHRLYFLTDDAVRCPTGKISEESKTVGSPDKEKPKVESNNVRKIREGLLLSKAELARRAKISVLTIDRVEKGMACRMDTKRKIILSLGLKLSDRDKVFNKG